MKEVINYRGFDIEIMPDNDAESPESWGNDNAFLVYDHRNFCVEKKGYDPGEIFECMQEKRKLFDGYYYFPVFAYIHSGVSLSLGRTGWPFSCPWDTSFKGFALVKRTKGWTWTREKAAKVAQSIVTEWNDYLDGNVWGYNVEETGDSCWGYYGDYDAEGGCLDEAKSCVDYYIKNERKSHFEKLKTWIKNKLPIQKRSGIKTLLLN